MGDQAMQQLNSVDVDFPCNRQPRLGLVDVAHHGDLRVALRVLQRLSIKIKVPFAPHWTKASYNLSSTFMYILKQSNLHDSQTMLNYCTNAYPLDCRKAI